jgi:hypothetical protein
LLIASFIMLHIAIGGSICRQAILVFVFSSLDKGC